MKTKTILKTLAVALLMPAMLLTTACSSDDNIIDSEKSANTKGYALPVTVNVTRQGDEGTRATYTDNGNGTGSLAFSTGDQLFVFGSHSTAGIFQGTLTWQSGGTFSGTLTTGDSYDGTAQALLESADFAGARLLPADYDDYDYFYFDTNGFLDTDYTKAFATSKATAVAQFSLEEAKSYSSGFALEPSNAILNFTITGLTPGSHNVEVYGISGAVTANGSGVATFAVGVDGGTYSEYINLLVDDTDYFDLDLYGGIDTPLEAGKIYNITRSAGPTYPSISTVTTSDYGKVVCAAGHLHDANTPVPSGCTGVGVIAKVTDGGHGLIMSLQDADENSWTLINFCTSVTYAGSTMKRLDDWMLGSLPSYTSLGSIAVSNWCIASKDDYIAMFQNLGSQSTADPKSYDSNVNAKIKSAGGKALDDGYNWGYWCATEGWSFCNWSWDNESDHNDPVVSKYVRPVLGF